MGDRLAILPEAIIYTDGACHGNPGPGGYGVIVIAAGERKEFSGGFKRTTNNRMELTAAIVGLEQLQQPTRVQLYTDSQYVANGINLGWARKWRKTGYKNKKNPDLWEKLLTLCERHEVKIHWIQGHAGQAENERCDQLSVEAAKRRNLPADKVFEQTETESKPLTLF
jgi:ribonuclease HI